MRAYRCWAAALAVASSVLLPHQGAEATLRGVVTPGLDLSRLTQPDARNNLLYTPTSCDGVTDVSAVINASLAADIPVQLPPSTCAISSTITVKAGSVLRGSSSGRTVLKWTGSSEGGPMFSTGEAGSPVVSRGVLQDITFEGNQLAATCLYLHNLTSWRLQNLVVQNCTTVQTDWDDLVFDNTVTNLTIDAGSDASTADSIPMLWGSGGADNVGYNRFYMLKILYKNGTGFECGYADNNHFYGVWLWRYPSGTANAMDLKADAGLASCQYNSFYGLTIAPASTGGSIVARNGTIPSRANVIYGFNRNQNSSPTVEAGSSLLCYDLSGDENACTQHAYGKRTPSNPTGVTDTAAYRMYGLAGSFKPGFQGRMVLTISGAMSNSTAGDGGLLTIRYGTGSAPSNGDAIPGGAVQCGAFPKLGNTPSGTFFVPFSIVCNVSGLTTGTTYWFDLSGKAITGGTLNLENVEMTYSEPQ